MNFENTIGLLESEIDSLKYAYKTEPNQEKATVYSSRILEHKKAITLLKKDQVLQLLQPDVIKSVCDCGKPMDSRYAPCCSLECRSDKFE